MRRIVVHVTLMLAGTVAVAEAQAPAIAPARLSAVAQRQPPARPAKKKKVNKPAKKSAAPALPPAPLPRPPPAAPPPDPPVADVPSRPTPPPALVEPAEATPPVTVSTVSRSAPPERAEPQPSASEVPAPAEQALPTLTVLVEPEWAYRRFLDVEPSATNKNFGTAGVLLLGGRVELYPLAAGHGALRDLGVFGSYARALSFASPGLATTDLNSNKSVDTQWYRYVGGLKYRVLGRSGPFLLGFFAGFQRWVFDFDLQVVPMREIPTARYSFLEGGADGRYSFGRVSLLFDAAYLQPLSVEPLGDRRASKRGYGVQGGLGAGFRLAAFEADLRATYTLVRLELAPSPGRSDEPGRVFDQYFGARVGLGASF